MEIATSYLHEYLETQKLITEDPKINEGNAFTCKNNHEITWFIFRITHGLRNSHLRIMFFLPEKEHAYRDKKKSISSFPSRFLLSEPLCSQERER